MKKIWKQKGKKEGWGGDEWQEVEVFNWLSAASAALPVGHGGHSWIHRCSLVRRIWRWPPPWKKRWFITQALNRHVWPPLHTAHAPNSLLCCPAIHYVATVRHNSSRYTDDTLVRVALRKEMDCFMSHTGNLVLRSLKSLFKTKKYMLRKQEHHLFFDSDEQKKDNNHVRDRSPEIGITSCVLCG